MFLKRIEEYLQIGLDGILADFEAAADFLDDLAIRVTKPEQLHDLRADEIEIEHVPGPQVEHDTSIPGVHVTNTFGNSEHAALPLRRRYGQFCRLQPRTFGNPIPQPRKTVRKPTLETPRPASSKRIQGKPWDRETRKRSGIVHEVGESRRTMATILPTTSTSKRFRKRTGRSNPSEKGRTISVSSCRLQAAQR